MLRKNKRLPRWYLEVTSGGHRGRRKRFCGNCRFHELRPEDRLTTWLWCSRRSFRTESEFVCEDWKKTKSWIRSMWLAARNTITNSLGRRED